METLRRWGRGLRINHIAQHRSAARYAMLSRALGIAVVVLSTAVGTAIFTTLNQSPSTTVKTIAGFLSVTAAVLGTLQTFLGFPQRQAAHHEAAVAYGSLRRQIESIGSSPSEEELHRLISDIRVHWDEIDASAPAVPPRIWKDAEGRVL